MIALMPSPHHAQRVDIEAAIGLVEHRQAWDRDAHLDHLGALLLAARKADVHRPLEHFHVHPQQRRLLARELEELAARQRRFAPAACAGH